MKNFSKAKPVWFKIEGTKIMKATFIGVRQYLRDNSLESCIIIAVQRDNTDDFIEVKHPFNRSRIEV
jgi:hypothetical protein